jgi:hypothetical protein
MIEVIRNGILWFEFPAANEQNVREMLMKKGVDRECIFRAKGEDSAKIAASIKSKLTTVEPTKVKTS